jgi:hypothetical protein
MIIAKCRLDSHTIRFTISWHELKANERMASSLLVTNPIVTPSAENFGLQHCIVAAGVLGFCVDGYR